MQLRCTRPRCIGHTSRGRFGDTLRRAAASGTQVASPVDERERVAPDEEAPEGQRQVPLVWVGVDDLPVQFVNQFVAVVQPNEVFLTIGTLTPPAIMGDSIEERREQAESIQFVQVKPVARIAFTPERLQELIGILNQTLQNYETQQRMMGDAQ